MKAWFALILLTPAAFAGPAVENSPAPPGAAAAATSQADLQQLTVSAEKELRENILPFWLKHARDRERGGFQGLIDQEMNVWKEAPRGALLTSRILWTFSAAYRAYRDPEYLEMARWAYRDLMDNFRDREFGGLYWSISVDRKPEQTFKQVYGQVFGIYGLTEFYRATGEQAALDEAVAIYRLIEQHAHDGKNGGYFDALDRSWQPQKNNLLGPAPKSQNSHIHLLEAFTNLLRVWPDEGLRKRQRELLALMLTRIIDPKTHHLVLFMRNDWTPVTEEYSYGHDIELSWLLIEAAEQLGDPVLLARAKPVAVEIARVTLAEGIDRNGGIFNEGNSRGPSNRNKDWWSQAEAAVGFCNAYQISRDPRYFAAMQRSWNFIGEKMVDRKNGDWYESLGPDGTPSRHLKIGMWKCPYHNSRCCLELLSRLRELGEHTGKP